MCCPCAGKSCLELGSGSGLLGVALAHLDVRELVLTDGDQTTLSNLCHNLRLNGVCEGDVRAPGAPLAPPVLVHHATSIGMLPCPRQVTAFACVCIVFGMTSPSATTAHVVKRHAHVVKRQTRYNPETLKSPCAGR